jgi:hypothetical protein
MVVGLVRPDRGAVRLGERDVTDLPMYRRARSGISYLPQEPSVFRRLTVEQNLLAILETLDFSPAERRQRADELLSEFGLVAVRSNRADTLSGGERRRVEIARSLVLSPSFSLLDEPFAGIDPIAVLDIRRSPAGWPPRGSEFSSRITNRARDFERRRSRLYNSRGSDFAGRHAACSLDRRRRQKDLSRGGFSADIRLQSLRHGPRAETQSQAIAAARHDAVAAASDQAAADVEARARRGLDAGDGREPAPRRGAGTGRGSPAEETRSGPGGPAPTPTTPTETPPETKERDSFEEIDFDSYFEDYLDRRYNPRQYEETEAVPLENTLSTATGPDRIPDLAALDVRRAAAVREIATYLIGNLDEDGYLRVSREEIRAAGFSEDKDVEAASRSSAPSTPRRRRVRPADCLMLQIRALGIANPLIEKIITEHWPEFLNRQFAPLARTLGVGMSQLQAVVEIIKNLEPKPGRKYSTERTIYVEPDVAVRKIGDEYVYPAERRRASEAADLSGVPPHAPQRERRDRRRGRPPT